MILCEPFTVFQEEKKKKNRALTTKKKGKIETEYSQWWRSNGGALMRFVITIKTEHSQHVNAIDFFFFFGGSNLEQWWRSSKRRDKGLNTKHRERESQMYSFVGFRDTY